jgi:hypothetical protein
MGLHYREQGHGRVQRPNGHGCLVPVGGEGSRRWAATSLVKQFAIPFRKVPCVSHLPHPAVASLNDYGGHSSISLNRFPVEYLHRLPAHTHHQDTFGAGVTYNAFIHIQAGHNAYELAVLILWEELTKLT